MTYTSPLYDPRFEHDACGIGAVVDIKGRKTYETVDKALTGSYTHLTKQTILRV